MNLKTHVMIVLAAQAVMSCAHNSNRMDSSEAETVSYTEELPSKASKLTRIPSKVRKSEDGLQQWVEELKIENVKSYEGGAYGKIGNSTVFIAEKNTIPDFDRLYWVMVKVLSEKYGCFMKKKYSEEKTVVVHCRDRRRIVFRRHQGSDWIQFYGRQYDLAGNELIVRR